MATPRKPKQDGYSVWDPGQANPKQLQFYRARTPFIAYGGAKGGGKTHAVRTKAFLGALMNPGIKILVMRQTYPALEENHIAPMRKLAAQTGAATYNGTTHMLTFANGSTIRFGHWSGEDSEDEYNGQEYDWIFIDEATQFSERAFNFLGGLLRGATPIPKRMYLTCNPGGVGHRWVKRLFIDKQYKQNMPNPEENENPADYTFIFATVEDNTHMLEHSPNYLRNLANMPEDLRRAYRYGDWDALGGGYFKEFQFQTHTMKPFRIPDHWMRYRSFDYGLDMFACIWWAVDTDGRIWGYREVEEKGLIAPKAAKLCLENSPAHEAIAATYAPPDMWNRMKETGKTIAELFLTNGVSIIRADNNRVQGHMLMKTMMAPMPLNDPYIISLFPKGKAPATMPGLMLFSTLRRVAEDIRDIQADEKNVNDCAKVPHEVTHTVDAVRYFCISRTLKTEEPKKERRRDEDEEKEEDYESFMCGGEPTDGYMAS
jgi:phage terminase large subunit